jgi:hypothetical protein
MNDIKTLESYLTQIPPDNNKAIELIDSKPFILLEYIGGDDLAYSLNDGASLIAYYACDDVLRHVMENHMSVIKRSKLVSSILAENDEISLDLILEYCSETNKIDDFINNSSALVAAIKSGWSKQYIAKIKEAGSDVLFTNTNKENAFIACTSHGDINIFNVLNSNNELKKIKKDQSIIDSFIFHSIRNNNTPIFDELLQYTQKSLDVFFKQAIQYKHPQILNNIVFEDDFLPGSEQLNQLIEVVTYNYDNEIDKSSSFNLIDFLFSVKVPFVKFVDNEENNIWNLAIENQNHYLIDKLLEVPELLNIQNYHGKTPLMYALSTRNHEIALKILSHKPDLNIKDNVEDTALTIACKQNITTVIKEILNHNPTSFPKNLKGESALYWATHNKNFEIVAHLLWHGAPLASNKKTVENMTGTSSLDVDGAFIPNNKKENITLNNFLELVNIGFNLNALNSKGESFPMHFIKNNQLSNFQSILNCKFQPNQQSPVDGNTILMEAIIRHNPRFLESFFNKFGSEISCKVKNHQNLTAMDFAIGLFNHHAVYKILDICNDSDTQMLKAGLPILLASREYTATQLQRLISNFNKPPELKNILTEDSEDIWFITVRQESKEDLDLLFQMYPEGPDFQRLNNNKEKLSYIVAQSSPDFVNYFNEKLNAKKKIKKQ